MGIIKNRKGKGLTEAEEIKKRWQGYTEELYKKRLNDWDNHNGLVTHLVKWALGSITTKKASGGDQIPAELFQFLKHDAVKVMHSVCQQIRKKSVVTDWKRSVFISITKSQGMFKASKC